MSIWTHPLSLATLRERTDRGINHHLGIHFVEIGPDFLRATMPVDSRTHQPAGLLHGGASVVLAESLGSVAAYMCIDRTTHYCVGVDVNATHVRSVREGTVTGTAKPLHIGRRNQVWEIRIEDEKQRLICTARLTTTALPVSSGQSAT